MRKLISTLCVVLLSAVSLAAQGKRLWVLRAAGEMVEYDPSTFAARQTVKVPAEAAASPSNFAVNHLGQMLFAPPISLPLADGDLAAERKVWLWDGRAATSLARDVSRSTATTGSNLAITESAPVPFLSSDGTHPHCFTNHAPPSQPHA